MSFAEFWKAYPRKIGKLAAQKAWAKAIKVSKPAEIIAGIAPYMENKPEWQDFCHPTTFLNQGRWLDEYEKPEQRVTAEDEAELDEFTRRRRLTEIVNKRKLELRFNVADITLTAAERAEADTYLQATSKTGLQT